MSNCAVNSGASLKFQLFSAGVTFSSRPTSTPFIGRQQQEHSACKILSFAICNCSLGVGAQRENQLTQANLENGRYKAVCVYSVYFEQTDLYCVVV